MDVFDAHMYSFGDLMSVRFGHAGSLIRQSDKANQQEAPEE
jgi:hypothetical protein